jgi:Carbohydrate esterase, sialic acid-specific acetylesterase
MCVISRLFLALFVCVFPAALSEQMTQAHAGQLNVAPPRLTIASPVRYQVFQRDGAHGSILISGALSTTKTFDIEASFNGAPFQVIATNAGAGPFSGSLPDQAAGEGSLTIRLKAEPAVAVTVPQVGIGDVYVIAGQSNASGRAFHAQSYAPSGFLTASLFGNDYRWHDLTDPTDSTASQVDAVSNEESDHNAVGASQGRPGGSYWPILASYILANEHVPVAFVPCALGDSSIAMWRPSARDRGDRRTLYGSMIARAKAVGGVRAVLWHQGESDAHVLMPAQTYRKELAPLASAVHADLGVKLVPAKLQSGGAIAPQSAVDAINDAIGAEWADDANVARGPDLSSLFVDDGFAHIQSDSNMIRAGGLWWEALRPYYYPAS